MKDFGPTINANPHAAAIFEKMVVKEAELAGDYAVFYHSYNQAAVIYELQAAVAHVLFGYRSDRGCLPRLLKANFATIPDAKACMAEFPKWPDRDHNSAFKSVGICVTTGLISRDPEATPTDWFLAGYAVSTVSDSILLSSLASYGVPPADQASLCAGIKALCAKYIPAGGHLLQIFVQRDIVDHIVYSALPYGVPDPTRHPLSKHTETSGVIAGQGRMICQPSIMAVQQNLVKTYTYSADKTFHEKRGTFQKELVELRPDSWSLCCTTESGRRCLWRKAP